VSHWRSEPVLFRNILYVSVLINSFTRFSKHLWSKYSDDLNGLKYIWCLSRLAQIWWESKCYIWNWVSFEIELIPYSCFLALGFWSQLHMPVLLIFEDSTSILYSAWPCGLPCSFQWYSTTRLVRYVIVTVGKSCFQFYSYFILFLKLNIHLISLVCII